MYKYSMIHLKSNEVYKKKYTLLWLILSFKGGFLNTAGFLIAGSYVSHVTGFGTQVGVAIGHHEYDFGLELLIIPIAFIGGASLVSVILDKNYSEDKIPNYPLIQLMITFLLGLISVLFSMGFFSKNPHHDLNTVTLIGLLCLVCGLKNGLTTWSTYGKIRTTHLTGLSTDIGLHLPKFFNKKYHGYRYPEERKINCIRIMILVSFSLGACISALLVPIIGYYVIHIAFFISVILSAVSLLHRKKFLLSYPCFSYNKC